MHFTQARLGLAGGLAALALAASGGARADDPFDPAASSRAPRAARIQPRLDPLQAARFLAPEIRAHERARLSGETRADELDDDVDFAIFRYNTPFRFGDRDYLLKLKAPGKSGTWVQVKIKF